MQRLRLIPIHFNSRPHGGRPRDRGNCTARHGDFNSRPHGGRPTCFCTVVVVLIFQLTPSRRATVQPECFLSGLLYFNSRPHGGRHRTNGRSYIDQDVFQLTPSRRATCRHDTSCLAGSISTHALTEGDASAASAA